MRKRKAVREKIPFSVRLLNILIAAMLIVSVSAVCYMVSELHFQADRERYSSISWDASQGNYPEMIDTCHRNGYDIKPFPTSNETSYQTALYADAAFMHLCYEAAGEEDLSAFFAERMAAAKAKTGELAPLTDDIDSTLAQIPLH